MTSTIPPIQPKNGINPTTEHTINKTEGAEPTRLSPLQYTIGTIPKTKIAIFKTVGSKTPATVVDAVNSGLWVFEQPAASFLV